MCIGSANNREIHMGSFGLLLSCQTGNVQVPKTSVERQYGNFCPEQTAPLLHSCEFYSLFYKHLPFTIPISRTKQSTPMKYMQDICRIMPIVFRHSAFPVPPSATTSPPVHRQSWWRVFAGAWPPQVHLDRARHRPDESQLWIAPLPTH